MPSTHRIAGALHLLIMLSVVAIASSQGLLSAQASTMLPSRDTSTLTSSSISPVATDRASRPTSATFEFTYDGVPAEARPAFQYAADIWARQITSSVPIKVYVKWTEDYSYDINTAHPHSYIANFPNAPQRDTLYPIALANKLAGRDLRTRGADDFDIDMLFTSFDWYYGTDANSGTKNDLVTEVLRALTHGLGFTSSFSRTSEPYEGRWGAENGFPYIFDRFIVDGQGRSLLDTTTYPNPSSELASAVGRVRFWNGENGRSAAGNTNPVLDRWDFYESINGRAFLDEETYRQGDPNALMTRYIGNDGAIHDAGPVVRGMLQDIGWTTQAAPFPGQPSGSLEIITIGALENGQPYTGASEVTVYVRNWNGSAERLRLEVDGMTLYDGAYQGGTSRWMVLRLVIPTFSGCASKTIIGTLEGNGERSAPFQASAIVDGGVDATVTVSGGPGALVWSPQTPRYEVPLDQRYSLGNAGRIQVTAAASECTTLGWSQKIVKQPPPAEPNPTYPWAVADGEYQFYVEVTDAARNTRRFPSETGVYTMISDTKAPVIKIDEQATDVMKDGLVPGYAMIDLRSFRATDNLYPDQGKQQEYFGYWVTQYLWTDIAPDQIDPPGGEVWYENGFFVRGPIPSTILLPIRRAPGVDPDDTLNRYRVWVRVVDGAGNISKPVSPKAVMTADVEAVHLPEVHR